MNRNVVLALLLLTLGVPLKGETEATQNILLVVQNSEAVSDQRQVMQDNMGQFIKLASKGGTVPFHIAVTTTDYFTSQGKLIVDDQGNKKATSDDDDPAAIAKGLIGKISDTATSFWPQGLQSSRAAITTYGSDFLSEEGPISIIYVTHRDDYSCKDKCYGVEPWHNTTWLPYPETAYIDYFRSLKSKSHPVKLYPIVGQETSSCPIGSLGSRYMNVADALTPKAFSADICLSKFKDSFLTAAKAIGQ